jgi:hypothetical protein
MSGGLALLLAIAVGPAAAAGQADGHSPTVLIGTLMTNVVYVPAKLVYAAVGALAGAVAYAITAGQGETARSIWDTTCRGTYVVTPSMLEGDESVHFSGT